MTAENSISEFRLYVPNETKGTILEGTEEDPVELPYELFHDYVGALGRLKKFREAGIHHFPLGHTLFILSDSSKKHSTALRLDDNKVGTKCSMSWYMQIYNYANYNEI